MAVHDVKGNIGLSDELLTACVADAALSVPGVVKMSESFNPLANIGLLGFDITSSRGVKITRTENTTEFDIYIIAEYGARIPQLAWKLQKKILNDLEKITGLSADKINIHVKGVRFKGEQDK
jgi:uncharacterized alkaline shock family protein YloU